MRELEVSVNGRAVGRLQEVDGLWVLTYAPAWATAADAFDLSPALPRSQEIHRDGATMRPVQWYFDNLLPEESLRDIIAKEAKLDSEDAFGLLAYLGAESAGSLVLRAPGRQIEAKSGLVPLPLDALSERLANLPKGESLGKNAPKRMSLAGAQHKLLIVMKGDDLFEPVGETPSTHILKPDHVSVDYQASVANEYFTMRLAKAVGLDVPDVHKRFVPQPVYIIDRFDRTGDDRAKRVHIIDTCQLLNKARTFKYTAAKVDTLAKAIQHCRAKAAARTQIYRWMIFNVLVGNGDNHLKNLAFIVNPDGIAVAPAYDMVSTAVYSASAMVHEKATWPNVELALSVGDATTFGAVTREQLIAAGISLKLSKATAERELDRMLSVIQREAERLMEEIEAESMAGAETCPDPESARAGLAGAQRVTRAIVYIIIKDMVARVSNHSA